MNLLKDIYNKIEALKGKPLYIFLSIVFVVFIAVGIAVGYFTNSSLKQDETQLPPDLSQELDPNRTLEYTGKIKYIDPVFYPEDKISYVLSDPDGKDVILLKAKDDKLKIAEGLTVKVVGTKSKTFDGSKDVLVVQEIKINSMETNNNAAN